MFKVNGFYALACRCCGIACKKLLTSYYSPHFALTCTFAQRDSSLKVHPQQAKAEVKAKNFFDIRTFCELYRLLPPANEVWGKVIFLHLFVILFTGGGGIPACLACPHQGDPLPRRHPCQGNPPFCQGDPPAKEIPPPRKPPVPRRPPNFFFAFFYLQFFYIYSFPFFKNFNQLFHHLVNTPLPMVNVRAVRILLECILVLWSYWLSRSLPLGVNGPLRYHHLK